ncbi:thiamine pyrophosphate-dependent enzyme [Coriobacteriia bacterium Es71-Z0120]|jgi:pyruvate ferredoxin oxidoreductase beta subunit|uniref:thiamine pyrophosphate-dependent enzyme n=1 Tax=Parvivirga hydrogeniphila TaxID=2939460 RepID=UPI002260D8A0|nr:thiamine pyrophosphate-dependent enzyme [Parvivirga hydrogeniphila]MCL4079528.1 thiamine pyrophosphate-dependent enzyme [Parvivirga hydrogeniphila]
MTRITELPVEERVLPGNRACAGCGLGIGLRAITKALEGRAVMTVPASCLTVLGGMYPVSSVRMPWVNCAFPSTAAVAAGIAAGLRATGRGDEMAVLAMAGDGGTADIGIQALSGAAERNEDLIYLCYDNEAYMNTGTQRSGSTPSGARTTTTWSGKRENPKDVPRIMEAHRVPYVAVTSAAFPTDVYDKVAKARAMRGLRYVHMHTPCPSGWGFDPALSVRLGKLAVESGIVVLYEVEHGVFRLTGRSAALAKAGAALTPVGEYLKAQSRFKGLDAEAEAAIQAWVDERWAEALERHARGA